MNEWMNAFIFVFFLRVGLRLLRVLNKEKVNVSIMSWKETAEKTSFSVLNKAAKRFDEIIAI